MFKNSKYVYGEGKLEIPAKLNFGEYILEKLWEWKDNVCLIDAESDKSITYGQILQESMNVAVCLSRMSLRKGKAVAICSENRLEYWGAVIGSVCAGAVVTTIDDKYSKDELRYILGIMKPKYIFCSPFFYKNYEKVFDFLKVYILFGDEKQPSALQYRDLVVPNESGLKENVKYEEFQVADVKGQSDTLFVLYSSGTTGLPKGVMLTHLNALAFCSLRPEFDVLKPTLSAGMQWTHERGLIGSFTAMATGTTIVFLAEFQVDTFLRAIEKYRISQLLLIPIILVNLFKINVKQDLSTVQWIYSTAAPLSKDMFKLLKTKFPKAQFLQQYGLTEGGWITKDRYDICHLAKQGGVGFAVGGTVIKIVDPETKQVLGPNQPGEICVKSVLLFKGYVGRDMNNDLDEEGFLKTGDLGYYDDDQYFFIVGRLKEVINCEGHQVPPSEIEALLLQHEGIKDAGVVGIPHRTFGEVPLAFVVRQQGSQVTEEEIQHFVASTLSFRKHLRGGVRFVSQIPKNSRGKILRKSLQSLVNQS